MDNVILLSISRQELTELIQEAVSKGLNTKAQKELLSVKELCVWLGISISTLNNWKAAAIIPFHRLGKRVFFKRAEILEALKESRFKKIAELKN